MRPSRVGCNRRKPTPALRDRCRFATAVASVKASQAFTPSQGGDFQERHNYEEPIHEI